MKDALRDANFPLTADGRVYHVGVKSGEVANRILTVGDHVRARRIAAHFDSKPFEHVSQRGFTTLTGRYKNVPVSIVAIGMGYPMIDFFVRECRAVVDGDMVIIRFGSCGTLNEDVPVGSLVVAQRGLFIGTDFDYFHVSPEEREEASRRGAKGGQPFWFSKPIDGDPELHDKLLDALHQETPQGVLVKGGVLHAAADSFYSSQGRIDANFQDQNETLIDRLKAEYPNCETLEMESTHLFHLAKLASSSRNSNNGNIRATAVHMTFAGRVKQDFIQPDQVEILETFAGKACLEALINFQLRDGHEHPEINSVWST